MTGFALPPPGDLGDMDMSGADLSAWMGEAQDPMQPLPPPSSLSPETRKILMEQIQRLSKPVERKRSMWTDPAFLAGMTLLGGGKLGPAAMAAAQAQSRQEHSAETGETRRATALASLTNQLARGDQMAAAAGAKTTAAQQKALTGALSLVAPTQRGVLYKAITEKQIDPTNLGAVYSFITENNLKLAPQYQVVPGVGLVNKTTDGVPEVVIPVQHAPHAPSDTERLLAAAGFKPGTAEYQAEARKLLAKKEGGGSDAPFAGTGMDAQAGNIMNRLGPKIADGSATPEEQRVYAYAYNHAAQPKPITDPESGKVYFVPQTVPPHFPQPTMAAPPAAPPGGAQPAPGAAPPSGAQTTAPSGVRSVDVMPPKPKEMTEGQANAALYADRMRASEKIIAEMEAEGTNPVTRGLAKIPVAGNYLVGPKFQQLDQAKRDFINATLRRESGAVISDSEFANADKQYFPVPGDSSEVLAQKKQNRKIALEGISRAAGKTYQPASDAKPGATGSSKFAGMSPADLAKVDISKLSAAELEAFIEATK